jgi:hypothetical protein
VVTGSLFSFVVATEELTTGAAVIVSSIGAAAAGIEKKGS